MSDGLTARQTQILKAIIDEYIETAEPVGSEALEKKYNLGVSPATIRNEMVALTKTSYLRQPHTSAGRIPAPVAMKFYIDQLMEERDLSVADEVKAKEEVWDAKDNFDNLIEEATHALADQTKNLAIAGTAEGKLWHAGYANLFSNPEFENLATCASLFSFIEEVGRMHDLFFGHPGPYSPVEVMFGEELSWPNLSPVGIVMTHFSVGGKSGALGIVGPIRLKYPDIIPTLRYYKNLIEEVGQA